MIDFKKLCRLLSDYFDGELESDICAEVDELVSEDFGCKVLFDTFNKTIELIKEMESEEIEIPEEVHISLLEFLRIEIEEEGE